MFFFAGLEFDEVIVPHICWCVRPNQLGHFPEIKHTPYTDMIVIFLIIILFIDPSNRFELSSREIILYPFQNLGRFSFVVNRTPLTLIEFYTPYIASKFNFIKFIIKHALAVYMYLSLSYILIYYS